MPTTLSKHLIMLTSLLNRRRTLVFAALVIAGACTADRLVGPSALVPVAATAVTLPAGAGPILISQVYGGGGNSGATIKNDYIELYNAGTVDVDLTGWSVQYAATTGTSWQVTPLSGTIAAGHYYLIQEQAGAGGTVALTPDLVAPPVGTSSTPGIAMAAGAGKVVLLTTTTALGGSAAGTGGLAGTTCPNNASVASIVDFVGYGTGTTCFEGTGPTGTVSATNAAFRKSNGALDNNNNSTDFSIAAAAPRNGGTAPVNTPVATVAPASPSLDIGATTTFTVTASLNGQPIAITSKAWTSSNTSVATIDPASGLATAVASGTSTITATVQTASGPATATTTLMVAAVLAPAAPGLVVSQVYGGGGNSGATYKNDYIELYNGGTTAVNLAGWSVQYSGATTAAWVRTPLSGTVQPGHYFLVQEGAGANGTTALPSPDLIAGNDSISMGATGGKIALVRTTSLLSSMCPVGEAGVADFVGYGASNCSEGGTPTAATSNTTGAFRKDGGRQDTDVNGTDFTVGAPAPRNGSTTPLPPLAVLAASITPANSAVLNGSTVNFTASAAQFGQPVAVSSSAWTSSNPSVATIDAASGVATAVGIGSTTIGVTATTANGTATSSTTLTVSAAPAAVTVTPTTWTLKAGQTKTFAASATDANGGPAGTTFIWTSSNPSVATIDANTGVATGVSNGTVTITATTSNNVSATATLIVTVGNFSIQARTDPLPVGFQTQLFLSANGTDAQGATVTNSTLTWTSADPSAVSVNPTTGVVTAHRAGTTTITATATTDGVSSATTSVITNDGVLGAAARTGHNTELGIPTDNDPSNDIIVARRQYTLSYNPAHGGPNWVSWNLDATHKGSSARCNCFTADTALTRLGITAYETNDWVNGGVWSRGHMSPSADWADSDGDNAPTFFLSNMIPQNQTANAGAWGGLEDYLRTVAVGSTEIYIMAGPIFTKDRTAAGVDGLGFMNSTGHIAVPDSMWKVAIVVPDARAASQIGDPTDVQVIAVNMANTTASVGSWTNFTTTIDKIQKSTGYDLLSALPENLQCKIEVRNCAPTAVVTGAGLAGGNEGDAGTFSASTSTDADNDALTFTWTVNGQAAGTGASLTYTFANNGSYVVAVTANDGHGGTSTASSTVAIQNVAPTVAAISGASIAEGSSYSASGTFTDPGSDHWTATVNYGDGSGDQPLALAADKSFALSHTYANNGSYQVTVRVTETETEAASSTASATVAVSNVAPTVAVFAGATIAESGTYSVSGSFADPGADHWSATVNYGDGSGDQPLTLGADKSFSLSHVYTDNGSYQVTVRVSEMDAEAATGSYAATVIVTNVVPSVATFAGATIMKGEQYASSGSFTDPGADTWTATVNYGDGSGVKPLTLTGNAFQLSHTYATAGNFTVTVQVIDKDGAVGTRMAAVVVQSAAQSIGALTPMVAALNGQLNNGQLNSLQAKLDAVSSSLSRGNTNSASGQLNAFINELNADVSSGKLDAATAAPLIAYAQRVLAAMGS